MICSLKNAVKVVLYQKVAILEMLVLRLNEVSVLLKFVVSVNNTDLSSLSRHGWS